MLRWFTLVLLAALFWLPQAGEWEETRPIPMCTSTGS